MNRSLLLSLLALCLLFVLPACDVAVPTGTQGQGPPKVTHTDSSSALEISYIDGAESVIGVSCVKGMSQAKMSVGFTFLVKNLTDQKIEDFDVEFSCYNAAGIKKKEGFISNSIDPLGATEDMTGESDLTRCSFSVKR
jgi:hypothetical protein